MFSPGIFFCSHLVVVVVVVVVVYTCHLVWPGFSLQEGLTELASDKLEIELECWTQHFQMKNSKCE